MQKLKSLPVLTFSSSSPTTSAPSPSNALPSPLSPGNGAGSRSGSRAGSRSRRPGTPKEKDSRARSVSPSPFRRSFGSLSQAIRGERERERESVDSGAESDGESVVGAMMRERRGGEESDSDSDSRDGDFERVDGQSSSESEEEWTEEVKGNTEANASSMSPIDFLLQQSAQELPIQDGPNLLPPTSPFRPIPKRKNTKSLTTLALHTSRPVFERNRCTITIDHGDPEGVGKTKKRTRKYLVASDMSEESLFAIEWAIGTVLRDGDHCLIVTVMEDEKKLDSDDGSDKTAKIRNQNERQGRALLLSKEATSLVERTRLNVRIICQAIHAKNARHMLVDMIDYLEPTLVLIGSRGLGKIKGMLLGSVSNYLIQKSSVPVMVARRRLRKIPRVHKPKSALNRDARVPLEMAAIEKESNVGNVHHEDLEKEKMEQKK
ncbi:adenine nucleotide alpha hydrolases-like protein [Atractiella rhizophila]|nr:adenine nucleotide alpha hydrolases-like protein [Atractiella rhizophila]